MGWWEQNLELKADDQALIKLLPKERRFIRETDQRLVKKHQGPMTRLKKEAKEYKSCNFLEGQMCTLSLRIINVNILGSKLQRNWGLSLAIIRFTLNLQKFIRLLSIYPMFLLVGFDMCWKALLKRGQHKFSLFTTCKVCEIYQPQLGTTKVLVQSCSKLVLHSFG